MDQTLRWLAVGLALFSAGLAVWMRYRRRRAKLAGEDLTPSILISLAILIGVLPRVVDTTDPTILLASSLISIAISATALVMILRKRRPG